MESIIISIWWHIWRELGCPSWVSGTLALFLTILSIYVHIKIKKLNNLIDFYDDLEDEIDKLKQKIDDNDRLSNSRINDIIQRLK